MNLVKLIWLFLGTISLVIGIAGVFVPGLPTTPFILLTAGLYVRSSDRLYQKLINNRFIGLYVKEFRLNKGMTVKSKLASIGTMWIMITISCVFLINAETGRLIVLLLGAAGTLVMGFIVPTSESTKNRMARRNGR